MPRAATRRARALALLGVGFAFLLQLPAGSAVGQSEGVSREPTGVDSTYLDAPPFPGVDFARALRLQVQSRSIPRADLDPGHVDLYNPGLSARLTLPINERAVARVNLRVGLARYDFSGPTPFKGVQPGGPTTFGSLADPLNLYQAKLSFDGAYQLNDEGESWLVDGEAWSLIGNLFGQSNWEGSELDEGLNGGVALGLGYRIPDRLRLSLGAVLRSDIVDGGFDISSFGSFRWSITDSLTLRDRGLGLLLEYRLSNRIEIFATGFRTANSSHLKDRFGQDDLTFRDRQVLVGAGFEWKIKSWIRMNVEVGGVVKRKLRVHSDDLGTLFSQRAEPAPYFELAFEVRPGRF